MIGNFEHLQQSTPWNRVVVLVFHPRHMLSRNAESAGKEKKLTWHMGVTGFTGKQESTTVEASISVGTSFHRGLIHLQGHVRILG